MPLTAAQVALTLKRRKQVEIATGLARSTIYKLMADGKFPLPVKLTSKAVAWRSDEIAAWIESRIRIVG
jgi:prophage regulatory protein